MRFALILLATGIACHGADLAGRIREVLESTPEASRGHLGMIVSDASSGEVIFESGSARLFAPASNTKLFSSALALLRLGPDFTFKTTVIADVYPDRHGRIRGNLFLVGGGDPNLSGRVIPYRVETPAGDPLGPLEDMVNQVVARGVTRIDGDIVGDDTLYPYEPYPDGWTIDDAAWYYGAPVSALTLNDNSITLTMKPGDPAELSLDPPIEYFTFDNRLGIGSPRRVTIERPPGSRHLRLTGLLPDRSAGFSERVAVDDPALFGATALRDALQRRGVIVDGRAVARHWLPEHPSPARPAGVVLAVRTSPRLVECLTVVNKVSQNLHAELMLRAVGLAARKRGSRDSGLAELSAFLTEIGVSQEEVGLFDGSGLSRGNLVTPQAVHKLLRYMYDSRYRELWMGLMPVGGEDGTLRTRFRGTAAEGRVHAKTGTLSRVAALSGYLDRPDGSRWIFSLLANFQPGTPAFLLDKLILTLLE